MACLLAALAGCAATPAEKTQAEIQAFQQEQTADKLLERGRAFAAIGDMTRAEEYLASAIDAGADPKVVMPLLLQVCVSTGRYRSAIQHAENHLRKHPGDARTRFVLGTLYAAVGETREAKEALSLVVEQRPDEAQAHYALAVLAREQNEPVVADRHFREYLRLEPSGQHAEEARAALLERVP